ncbi:MAG: lipopolysaccharide heptosyltransferase II [Planctomycetia bacterium]|nr:lipopolysaccharide heptosyltransferase II [Planctomycetia bacterium]
MKIAIFIPNWIGDAVMATPALAALRDHYGPDAELVGVMRPYVAQVLDGTGFLNGQLFYDPRGSQPDLHSWSLVRRLRELKPDVVLLLTNSARTGLLAYLSGAPRRVGFARGLRGWLLTDKLSMRTRLGKLLPQSAMDNYLRLATLLGCKQLRHPPRLATSAQDEAAADGVWQRLSLPTGNRTVVFHNGGGWGGQAEAKAWPPESFAELARRIAEQHGLGVLVLCGPAERDMAAGIAALASHPLVQSLAKESLSIGLSKACVRRSRLMVSTDSGPRHFAHAFDVPLVTLYGATHIAWGDTHYERTINLQHQLPCGPCMKRVCPLKHHRCMTEMTVDEVYQAVEAQLAQLARSEAA